MSIIKRSKTVQVQYRNKSKGNIRLIAIDYTGLKVFGERVESQKTRKRKAQNMAWCKMHLVEDVGTHEVISAEASLVNVGDSEVLLFLLHPLRRKIGSVFGDGAYDTKEIQRKGIIPLMPPRKNAGFWDDGHSRTEAVKALKVIH